MKFAICFIFLVICTSALAQDESDELSCPQGFVHVMKAAHKVCLKNMWQGVDKRSISDSQDTPRLQKRSESPFATERPPWKDDPEFIQSMQDAVPCMEKNLKKNPYYDKVSAICDDEAAKLADDKYTPAEARYDCMVGYISQCFGPILYGAAAPWYRF